MEENNIRKNINQWHLLSHRPCHNRRVIMDPVNPTKVDEDMVVFQIQLVRNLPVLALMNHITVPQIMDFTKEVEAVVVAIAI